MELVGCLISARLSHAKTSTLVTTAYPHDTTTLGGGGLFPGFGSFRFLGISFGQDDDLPLLEGRRFSRWWLSQALVCSFLWVDISFNTFLVFPSWWRISGILESEADGGEEEVKREI
jgi:hypothetical protein